MNYYERHIGDYLKATAHLSLLEHGVYSRLMDVYYTREEGIPEDQAARLIGARSKDELSALRMVLGEFFNLRDPDAKVWTQDRCEREIARYQDKQRKAKASAEARWSQTERNANASPNAMRTHSEGNAPSNQTPVKEKKKRADRPALVPLPENFCASERVLAWAAEKKHGQIAKRLEHFIGYAKRSGKRYADWDEAFMGAVREDWAKLGAGSVNGFHPAPAADPFAIKRRSAAELGLS